MPKNDRSTDWRWDPLVLDSRLNITRIRSEKRSLNNIKCSIYANNKNFTRS